MKIKRLKIKKPSFRFRLPRIRFKFLKVPLFWVIIIFASSLYLNLPQIPVKISWWKINIDTYLGGDVLRLNFLDWERDVSVRRGLDLQGGLQVVLEADMSGITEEDRSSALESAREAVSRRVDLFGVSESSIYSSRSGGNYRIIVELPGVVDTDEALNLIGQTAQLEVKELDPEAEEGSWSFISTGLTGADLQKATVVFSSQTGQPQVSLQFSSEGGEKSKEITERNLGKTIGFFLDDIPLSLATVQSVIKDQGVISGTFSLEEAKRLAIQLNAGALPVPISILSQKEIGATLGEETLQRGLSAGLVGLVIVFLFMWIYYGKLGFFAGIGLIFYGLITLALYRLIPVTLTFAGIAGFLLSIGMAVDSNILVFERYREEEAGGNSGWMALEKAFGRTWDSIRDANVCTLITCFVLFNPLGWEFLNVSGVVRGFALTLTLGIFVGMFTGIFVTRTLLRLLYR